MSLSCEQARDLILDRIQGELPAGEDRGLQAHLASCASCRESLEESLALLAAVRPATEVAVSENFAARVAALAAEGETDRASDRLTALLTKPRRTLAERVTVLRAFAGRRVAQVPAWTLAVAFHAAAVLLLACFYIPYTASQMAEPPLLGVGTAKKTAKEAEPPVWNPEDAGPNVDGTSVPGHPGKVNDIPLPRIPERGFEPAKNGETVRKTPGTDVPAPPGMKLPSFGGKVGAWVGTLQDAKRKARAYRKWDGADTASRLDKALSFLSGLQQPDGGFDVGRHRSAGNYRVGVSGLALLAFLGNGSWRARGPHGLAVEKAVAYLLAEQDGTTGRVGPDAGNYMYNHGIAANALILAYALERREMRANTPALRAACRKAVAFIYQARNESGAFGYTARERHGDTSVTAWQLSALELAAGIGLVDSHPGSDLRKAADGVRQWLDRVRNERGYVGYRSRSGQSSVKTYPESMTAVGLYCLCALPGADETVKKAQAALVLGRPPRAESLTDYYYLYYATVALIRADRAAFARWNGKVKAALAAYQKADGGFGGRSRYSEYGGRALTTALAALALEAYFRGE